MHFNVYVPIDRNSLARVCFSRQNINITCTGHAQVKI